MGNVLPFSRPVDGKVKCTLCDCWKRRREMAVDPDHAGQVLPACKECADSMRLLHALGGSGAE